MDRGTETGVMCTIHSYLRAQHGDVENGDDCVRSPSSGIDPSKLIYMHASTIYRILCTNYTFGMQER